MSDSGEKEYRKWVKCGTGPSYSTRYYRQKLAKKRKVVEPLNVEPICVEDPTHQLFDEAHTPQRTASSSVGGQASGSTIDIDHIPNDAIISRLREMASDEGSTDDQLGPKEEPKVKRRKLRRKTIVRLKEDTDDALSSSSEAQSSSDSLDSTVQCSSQVPSPVNSPVNLSPSPVPSESYNDVISDSGCGGERQSPVLSPVPTPEEPQVNLSAIPLTVPLGNAESCNDEVTSDKGDRLSGPSFKSFETLCPCTNITVQELMFMTLTLGLRHGLTWVAQVDILKMLSTIFKSSSIPTTKHLYKESLNVSDEKDIQHHVFCRRCYKYLGLKEDKIKVKFCETFKKDIKVTTSSNCFVSLSIEAQLQKFFKDDHFVNSLTCYRFERTSTPGVYSEIYDGAVYKQFSAEGGILASPYNFSFTFFTDGVAYGKSSNKTIWPIYLTVNELPYFERSRYFILAGVYAGPKDPNELYFLKPFVDAMNRLSSRGVDWVHNGEKVTSIAIPLCCVVDSVARYQLLNYQNFFGAYGCTFCYKETVYVQKTGSRYPVDVESPQPRTVDSYYDDLQGLLWKKNLVDRSHRGVKGPCNLFNLNHFSLFDGFVVDYMHCVLLGVVKRHTELLLESTRRKMWIDADCDNIGVKTIMALIDKKITALQSTTAVIRELRGITAHALWRASEWRLWALFYFIPCLRGMLQDKYIVHFGLLSKAMNILLKRSVTDEDVNLAHKLLLCYTFYFDKYFGLPNMVYNIHLLSHISKCVRNFGPIWGHSSFPYESQNRYLVQLCKSPYCVPLQVARKFVIYQSLPDLACTLGCSDKILHFSDSILNYKKLVKCHRASNNSCILLGSVTSLEIPIHIQRRLGTNASKCCLYQRIIYNTNRYATRIYCDKLANNDSYLFLQNGKCVVIDKIMKTCHSDQVFLGVQIVDFDEKPLLADAVLKYDCMYKVLGFKNHVIVPIEEIDEPCLLINVQDTKYIARIPYACTVE
ncbi:hypothetical protein FOCC_FOCC016954 [Frankliniella occidentalis]|nr:hypothetical protein FOCC_FOCC016954 [Frankliniella occidentalis]